MRLALVLLAVVMVAVLAPVALLLAVVYARMAASRPPWRAVLRVYGFSLPSVIPAILAELVLAVVVVLLPLPLLMRLLLIAAGIGLIEERLKLAFLDWLAIRRGLVRRVSDGIVFAVAVSLAFATMESSLYAGGAVIGAGSDRQVALLLAGRALLVVPLHAVLGVLMGWSIGRRAGAADDTARQQLWRAAWLRPAVAHGVYDAIIVTALLLWLAGWQPVAVLVWLVAVVIVLFLGAVALDLIRQAGHTAPTPRYQRRRDRRAAHCRVSRRIVRHPPAAPLPPA